MTTCASSLVISPKRSTVRLFARSRWKRRLTSAWSRGGCFVGVGHAAIVRATAERWTVARLAKIAGMSRAAFARRFAQEVGAPPLRHVAEVRMRRAAALLAGTDAALAAVAVDVGYANEFALSRAFRRWLGEPPGVYRRRVRESGQLRAAA